MLDGLRGEHSIAELCRREGIAESLYYSWSKEFLEAGKRRLAGDTARAATSSEVKDLRRQAQELKEVVAEQALDLRLLKKSRSRMGETRNEIPASEKLEIIRLVEQSHLPVRRTLEKIGILPAAFYRWYNRYQTGGPKPWKIDHPSPSRSGTASLMPSEAVSCSWRWMSRSCHRGNWPRGSRIRKTICLRSFGLSPAESP